MLTFFVTYRLLELLNPLNYPPFIPAGGAPAPIVASGWNSGLTNSVQMYNVTASAWTALAPFPVSASRTYHCMANNRLFTFGGWGGGATALELNLTTMAFKSIGSIPQATDWVGCIAY